MKTLIISDVHSNIVALEEVWKHESDADLIVSPGDIVDCGPFPRECIDWFIDHNVVTVRGNHDDAVIREYSKKDKSPNWDAHNAKLLDKHHIEYLKDLPKWKVATIDGERCDHGIVHLYHKYDTIDSLDDFTNFSKSTFGEPLGKPIVNILFGHTHKQSSAVFDDTYRWYNPGSISYRHGERIKERADYIVWTDGVYEFRSVMFSNEKLHQAVKTADVCQNAKNAAYTWW